MADLKNFTNGLIKNNPTFVQVLGMCPTLATTTSAENGLGMGIATLAVLTMSNIVISLIRKIVPKKIRIPIYIVIIASFVTMIDLIMHGLTYELWQTLGIFIPLIVVNCIIMGRAESFASKNGVLDSIFDALGIGLGFTGALVLLGSVRELLGNGTIFGFTVWGDALNLYLFILPPGAFITLGLLLGMFNSIGISRENKKKKAGAKK
ncbi:electron transport complex, RnfABCDGE type, E subunit [Petrotoga mobilis SJ95]|jgi:electron transport complex protein RnfE|uniref:Ion-translocating oxidoreductase complex subunit E n=1 Tax=Petrotoga mobilis (strain DSM 10674 / SJ95) TaxID=403833 RepID=A9BJD3_PETMO|nr:MULTISPECIES: electron transport complex subunit E [Petrotoga]ABX31347.1 electron transport complex, RnfABCDGE type, E subunit [Petrotoga mobilis SJ95]MBL5981891.1 electron transporter RsxE [Petrotoga sp. 8T1HF07.NaAc.6.1]PNR87405.1 electron transporter RsxE [Petrotoga sp. 9T1HF07.CasAA.8.2]PNR93286.1 electron transporter RsxE [Petrotoga sp. HWHPT.55.6.3]RLL82727.1 electron transporter RsxE [Petrotoga sp. Shatin.DS.tank11.9.2.9.3]